MGRKRKGTPIDGWLAIDKPVGIGSTKVVAEVRRILGAAKVGHGGTLDPLASGILPIALGEATKTVQWVMDGSKTYRWRVRWGQASSTDDGEGEIVATSDVRPSREQILAAIPQFLGSIEQVPPVYSAIKIDGERAYDLARAGEEVAMKTRIVQIDRFELVGQPDADHADFEVACGKGTYIRALARDIAKAVGTCGHVTILRRIACGPFNEANAIPLDKFREVGQGPAPRNLLLPVETALDDIPALALTEAEARRLHSGQTLTPDGVATRFGDGQIVRAMNGTLLVALARVEGGLVRSVRVMNLKPLDTE